MNADLVLEGGGVKGIGLVGAIARLAAEGYEFKRVAGTSAGAIVGALVAAGMGIDRLEETMRAVDYARFKDESVLDRFGRVGKGLSVIFEKGIYEGEYLKTWLAEQLESFDVRTFGDLRIDEDRDTSLPEEKRYRLVVMAADISRGRLIRLPWDYRRYGLNPDDQPVVDAVRASMSIPFFYEPVTLTDRESKEKSFIVDGGVLSNFPIAVFDRTDNQRPRWPTLGIKLSARPGAKQAVRHHFEGPLGLAAALFATTMSAHDQMHLDDECVVARTIFVDTLDVRATDFDLDEQTQAALFDNGKEAAGAFLESWDFDDHIERCRKPDDGLFVTGPVDTG